MNGVILCGGLDLNLHPITYTMPKSMIPLGNFPLLHYNIKRLTEAGIDKIFILIGENGGDIINYFKDGRDYNCRIRYFTQQKPLGSLHALTCTKDHLDGSFILIFGDNYFDFSLSDYISEHQRNNLDALLITSETSTPWDYGMVTYDNEKLIKVLEKPRITKSKTSITGIYIFNQSILKAASRIKASKRGQYEITTAIQFLLNNRYKVQGMPVNGTWMEIKKLNDILTINKHILSKEEDKIAISNDSRIIESDIQNYTSIGKRCLIKNATISNSIVMDDCIIEGVEIYDSIICSYSTIIGEGETMCGIFSNKTSLYLNAIK